MTSPSAVGVDASGNVYVADAGNGKIYELTAPLSAGVQVAVASGYSNPSGLAVDPSGSLFVVDRGNSKVWRIPNISGTLAPAKAVNVASQTDSSGKFVIADPYGIAIDSTGNLYISDNRNAAAYKVSRTNPTQSFGTWTPGTTSGTLSYYLENSGNAALMLGSPYYAATGDTTQFSILSGGTGECAAGATVAAGSSCNLDAQFAPSADGDYTDILTLSSNAYMNGQQLTFTGTGAITTPTTTRLAITSPSGSPTYDEAVSLSATVSASTGTPVGSVNLMVDGIAKETATLSNGVATFTIPAGVLSGGSHTLQAAYAGGVTGFVTFSQSASSSLTLDVLSVSSATTVSYSTLYTSPDSQPAGTPIVFTATVGSTYAGVPTGTVTFTVKDSSGTLATGIGTLQPAGGGTFHATYTYANTAVPANGTMYDIESVVATYSGDTNFNASSSASSSFDVSPTGGSVDITSSSTSMVSEASGTSTISFTPTSYGGWNGLVGFGCLASSLPANARCVFAPGQTEVLASTPTSSVTNLPVQMWVSLNQPPQTPTASGFVWWLAAPLGLLLLFARRRYAGRLSAILAIAAVAVLGGLAVTGLSACGSSTPFLTPTGTSTVTVVAYTDPFTTAPTKNNANPATQACPSNDPTQTPCSEQTFKVALTVK
jgi:hypothetical protein